MSHYSGFSGTKAFSGAHNNSMAQQNRKILMNRSKRDNSVGAGDFTLGTPGYHTIQNEPHTKEQIQAEFESHFKNANRDRGRNINHHDFLDSSFLPKMRGGSQGGKTFFSQMGINSMNQTVRTPNPYSMEDHGSAVDLGRQRIIQAKKKYRQRKD